MAPAADRVAPGGGGERLIWRIARLAGRGAGSSCAVTSDRVEPEALSTDGQRLFIDVRYQALAAAASYRAPRPASALLWLNGCAATAPAVEGALTSGKDEVSRLSILLSELPEGELDLRLSFGGRSVDLALTREAPAPDKPAGLSVPAPGSRRYLTPIAAVPELGLPETLGMVASEHCNQGTW